MIYPFKCKGCGTEFNIEMSVKKYETVKVTRCPVCKSKEVKRTFFSNGISIQYKDDGFTKFVGEDDA